MTMRRHLGLVLAAGAWAAWIAGPCGAQGPSSSQSAPPLNPAPCSVAPEPQPCGTTPTPSGKASPKDKFPFPGEAGAIGPSTSGPPVPSLSGVPQAPDAGSTPADKKDPAKEFPFPGDAGASPAPGTSSSSSSSSGDDASPDAAAPGLTDKGSEGSATPGRHLLHRVNPIGTKLQTIDEREQEDLDVAHFYIDSGDLQGAFLRDQDAVKVAPDDPDAHIALAELALKLNKPDVAAAEYNACLKIDEDAVKATPNDPDAHFLLAEMAVKVNKPEEAIAEYTASLKLHPSGKEAREARKALANLKQPK